MGGGGAAPAAAAPAAAAPAAPAAGAAGAPAVVFGGGRVGAMLAGAADPLLGRAGAFPPGQAPGPVFVCTRNDALDDVLARVPRERRGDLVLFQNGMLETWMAANGLSLGAGGTEVTQVLAYFAVAKLGEAPTDGLTEEDPEGLTAATGPWAEEAAARLRAQGLSCKVLDAPAFRGEMFLKLIWISSVMLVGASRGGCSVGEVDSEHRGEWAALVRELVACAEQAPGGLGAGALGDPERVVARLSAYSRSVAHFPTAVKEFPWRNGWFHAASRAAVGAWNPDPCPTHSALLAELGVADIPAEPEPKAQKFKGSDEGLADQRRYDW